MQIACRGGWPWPARWRRRRRGCGAATWGGTTALLADQGREARHPFLAEAVMQTLLALPLPLVADLRLPPGAALCSVTPQILVLRWLRQRSLGGSVSALW